MLKDENKKKQADCSDSFVDLQLHSKTTVKKTDQKRNFFSVKGCNVKLVY